MDGPRWGNLRIALVALQFFNLQLHARRCACCVCCVPCWLGESELKGHAAVSLTHSCKSPVDTTNLQHDFIL